MIEFFEVAKLMRVSDFSFFLEVKNPSCIHFNVKKEILRSDTLSIMVDDSLPNGGKVELVAAADNLHSSRYSHQNKPQILQLAVVLNNYKKINVIFVFCFPVETHQHICKIFNGNVSVFVRGAQQFVNSFGLGKSLMVNSKIMNIKTISVLETISSGATRNEAATMLFISERGVDYHIDLAKSALHTDTIASTIYQASLFGVFSKIN